MKAVQLKNGDRFIHPSEPGVVWEIIAGFAGQHPKCKVISCSNSYREIGTETHVLDNDEIFVLWKINPLLDKMLRV